jgi:uncharacterized protein with gpF-like domain
MKFFNSKRFKDLEAAWEEKLKRSGFVDIEKKKKNGERVLKQNSANVYRQANEATRSAREQYYRVIAENYHQTEFNREIDRIVMGLFAEGCSIKNIVLALNEKQISIHRQTIRFIIRRHEHIWGIKYWSAKERNLNNE